MRLTQMQQVEIGDVAKGLMALHGLNDWRFTWDRAKTRFGACHYHTKTISLSAYLAPQVDMAHVQNTILHEVAHALAGWQAHHGPVWRAVARRIGANPQRCSSAPVVVVGGVKGTCTLCGATSTRTRMPRRTAYCRPCHQRGVWHPFVWARTA